jgi:hypothetical protein
MGSASRNSALYTGTSRSFVHTNLIPHQTY